MHGFARALSGRKQTLFWPIPREWFSRTRELLSQLGLAQAYAKHGDSENSRKAYDDFFATWKDADPNIPILKQAKAEYAKLQ